MSVAIFSYAGEVTIGLMVDARLVPDPGGNRRQVFEQEIGSLRALSGQRAPRQGA